MSWQIGNEPRAFSQEAKQPFAKWLAEASALIRSLDKNHLISIGSEGSWGCENDMALYEQICSDVNIDYMNIHLWPYNWGWAHERTLRKDFEQSCRNTKQYIDEHLQLASRLGKPVVMEEFGFPRDGFSFSQESTTIALCSDWWPTMPSRAATSPDAISGDGAVRPIPHTSNGRWATPIRAIPLRKHRA